MKLLDTNVLNYHRDKTSPFKAWADQAIEDAILSGGAAVNPVILAEFCSWVKSDPNSVPSELEALGIDLVDLPAGAGPICGAAYGKYAAARKRSSQKTAPAMPLPDFFIGAHAEAMGWTVITNDTGRFKTYFPKVKLETP
jgi:predicted nucleic acid-binding protein